MFVKIFSGFLFFVSLFAYGPHSLSYAKQDVLRILTWEEYLAPDVVADFEKQTGVRVEVVTCKDEDEIISMLISDPGRFDLVDLMDKSIQQIRGLKLLRKINLKNIKNFANIDENFQAAALDVGGGYFFPYMYGTLGIAFNKKFVKEEAPSWGILWNPDYAGKIAMLANPEECIGMTLKYLGYSINTANPDERTHAEKKLFEQKKLIVGYLDTVAIRDKLISGELWAGMIYNGDAFYAIEQNPDIRYVLPQEGFEAWLDGFCIPHDAPRPDLAEKFLDYLNDPEVNARNAETLGYSTCNRAARAFVKKWKLDNKVLYTPMTEMKRGESFVESPDPATATRINQMMNKTWSRLRSLNSFEEQ